MFFFSLPLFYLQGHREIYGVSLLCFCRCLNNSKSNECILIKFSGIVDND